MTRRGRQHPIKWLSLVLGLALVSCQPLPPPEEESGDDAGERPTEEATAFDVPVQTQSKAVNPVGTGFDPNFDRTFGFAFKKDCDMSKQVQKVDGGITLKYYFTRTKLEDVFKVGGKFDIDIPVSGGTIGASASGQFSTIADAEEESLYIVATAYVGFDVMLKDDAEKKLELNEGAQAILDDMTGDKPDLTPAQGALKWLDAYGPGFINDTQYAAKMIVLYKFKNSDVSKTRKIGASLSGKVSIGKIINGQAQLDVTADVNSYAKSSEVSVFVKADGFLLSKAADVNPAAGADSKTIFEKFMKPALMVNKEGPFNDVASAIGDVFTMMTVSARRDVCAAIKSLHVDGDATVGDSFDACTKQLAAENIGWDGRVAPQASIRAYLVKEYRKSTANLFGCLKKLAPDFTNTMANLAVYAAKYYQDYGRLRYASDIIGLQRVAAPQGPGGYIFADAATILAPIDKTGFDARLTGKLKIIDRTSGKPVADQPALADRQYDKLLDGSDDASPLGVVLALVKAFDLDGGQFYGRFLGGIKLPNGMDYDPMTPKLYSYEKSMPESKLAKDDERFKNLFVVLDRYKKWDWCPQIVFPFIKLTATKRADIMCTAGGLPTLSQLPAIGAQLTAFSSPNKIWISNTGSNCADKQNAFITVDTTLPIDGGGPTTVKTYVAADATPNATQKKVECSNDANDAYAYICTQTDGNIWGETAFLRDNLLNFNR